MAGFRKNIHKNIRMALDERVRAASSYGGSNEGLRSELLGPVSEDTKPFNLTFDAQMSKTPFIRMISPGESSTEILYGMFNDTVEGVQIGGALDQDFFESRAEKIGPTDTEQYRLSQNYKDSSTDDYSTSDFGKPIPGIIDAEIQFVKYGGAVRKATVNWTCYTLNDLEKYSEGSFLSPGRNVILDWGWVRSGKGMEQVPKILTTDGNGKVTLDEALFAPKIETYVSPNDDKKKIFKSADSAWEMLWKQHYGDWGGLIGIISNMSWNMNKDGSFACTTEILAKGTSVFEQQIPSPKKEQMNELPLGQNSFDSFIRELTTEIADGKDVDLNMLAGPALNIQERVNTLDIEIMQKYFGDILEKKAKVQERAQELMDAGEDFGDPSNYDEGDIVKVPAIINDKDFNIVGILEPTGGTLPDELGGSFNLLEYEETDPNDPDADPKLKRSANISAKIWVRWGWFEDNIVSYYAADQVARESGRPEAEFRSIERVSEAEDPDKKTESGLRSIKIKNTPNLYTYDPNVFILPGQYPEDWHQNHKKESEEDEDNKSTYRILAEYINANCPHFSVDESKTQGYLRNVMINLGELQSVFSAPGHSIQSAMLKLAGSLNSQVKVWNFAVDKADNISTSMTTYFIHEEESADAEEEQNDDPSTSYIFENYGLNSVVKDISLGATMPDKFAVMAGYGSFREEEQAKGDIDIVRNLLRDRSGDSSDEAQAKAVGEFFANPANVSKIGAIKKSKSDLTKYGHVGGKNNDIGELEDEGLEGSKWNHQFNSTLTDLNPGSKANYSKQFEAKFKDSLVNAQTTLAATKGEILPLADQQNLNVLSFPSEVSEDVRKNLKTEFKRPYDLNGTLRSHFMTTLKWYHEDSPLTKTQGTSKSLTLPLELDMTIEGCSGLFAGNMFRLSYLPKKMYGQTSVENQTPRSYFHISGVTHTIDKSGWDTKIQGRLNRYNPEAQDIEDNLRKAAREWKETNRKKLDDIFEANLRKMAYEDPKE